MMSNGHLFSPSSSAGRRNRVCSPQRWAILGILLALFAQLSGCYRDSESRLVEIRALHRSGEFEASVEPIRVLLHTDPINAEANYRLGVALVQTGRSGLAIWPLQKAAQSEEYGVQAGIVLAGLLSEAGDYEEAVRTADQVLSIDPERVAAIYTRGEANIGAGRPEAALEDAERLLEIRESDYEAFLIRASALTDLERLDEAEQAFRDMISAAGEMDAANAQGKACALLAAHLASQKKAEEADAQYRECLENFPDQPIVMQYATNYYTEFDRPDEAIAMWRRAVEESPENFITRASLAELLIEQKRSEEAEAVLAEAVDLFDTAAAWQSLSTFYQRQGDVTNARKALENALDRTPGQPETLRFALADLLVTEGEIDKALELAEQIREPAYRNLIKAAVRLQRDDAKGALEIFEAGLRLWPNNAGARFMAGSAAEQMGDLERAAAEYREALRVDSTATDAGLHLAAIHLELRDYGSALGFADSHILDRPLSGADAHIVGIRAATALERYEAATRLIDDLEKKQGVTPISVTERAGVVRATEGPEAAIAVVKESGIDLSAPESLPLLRALAQDLTAIGRTNEALAAVRKAQAGQDVETADLFDLQGRIELIADDRSAAKQSFEQALGLDPEHASTLLALSSLAASGGDLGAASDLAQQSANASHGAEKADALYFAAELSKRQGKTADAIDYLQQTLRSSPGHVEAANNLAWELAESGGDLNRALELAMLAARGRPSATTLDTLGWVQLKREQPREAARAFEAALSEAPDSATILYHLALALASQGDTDRAKELLRKSLEDPEFSERPQAQLELTRLEGS